MTDLDRLYAEIEALADEICPINAPYEEVNGFVYWPRGELFAISRRLRALLPKEPELEDVVEEMLNNYFIVNDRHRSYGFGERQVEDLRAALQRRMGK